MFAKSKFDINKFVYHNKKKNNSMIFCYSIEITEGFL